MFPFPMAAEGEVTSRMDGLPSRENTDSVPWGRNPFLTPVEEARGGRAAARGLAIQTIITGRDRSVATVGGQTVSVGDRIGDEVVVDIRPDAVVLERNRRRRVLRAEEFSRIVTEVGVTKK